MSASWPGIAMVANHVFNVTASLDVWEQTARLYSFIGGGLGSAGKVNSGNKYFLEVCRFGSHSSAGCFQENAARSFQELATVRRVEIFSIVGVATAHTSQSAFREAQGIRNTQTLYPRLSPALTKGRTTTHVGRIYLSQHVGECLRRP